VVTMLERRSRKDSSKNTPQTSGQDKAPSPRRFGPRRAQQEGPPPSAGPEEETVRIAHKDFRKRRHAGLRRRVRQVVLALLALTLVAGSVWVVFFSSYVTTRSVDITGNRTLGEPRIEHAAEVPIGTPLARVDLDAIRARLESIAAVRRVEVSRSWPHSVHIAVTERTPLAVIERDDRLQALDSEGVLFGRYGTRPGNLPLVRTESKSRSEALIEAARVIDSLPVRVAARVDTVEVASVDQIKLVLGNGRRVVWGSAEDSEHKAEVLAVLLTRPSQEIDVSVPGRPTTR
jgi:cell division protein FtsQ